MPLVNGLRTQEYQLFVWCDRPGESSLQEEVNRNVSHQQQWAVVIFRVKSRAFVRWWYLCLWSWFWLVRFLVRWLVVKISKLQRLVGYKYHSIIVFLKTTLTRTITLQKRRCPYCECSWVTVRDPPCCDVRGVFHVCAMPPFMGPFIGKTRWTFWGQLA